MSRVAWAGGALVDPAQPVVAADDHGLVVGDGVFETVRVSRKVPFALGRHLDRLARGADGLGIVADFDAVRAAIATVLSAPDAPDGLARLRITLTGGRSGWSSERGTAEPTLLVGLEPASEAAANAEVAVVPWSRNERAASAGLKTISYADNVIALRYAHQRGASEAVFANTRGELCEGTGSNVFVGLAGRLLTPPLSAGCLPGVTRALLLEWLPEAVEEVLGVDDLQRAPEAFLASTMRSVQPIRSVDGQRLPAAPGPLSARAAAVFAERAAADPEP